MRPQPQVRQDFLNDVGLVNECNRRVNGRKDSRPLFTAHGGHTSHGYSWGTVPKPHGAKQIMSWREQIEQELVKAAAGLQEGNDGLARVCARRAVALGVQNWVQRSGAKTWPADAMNQLREIQADEMFPVDVREAAQRLLTKVTQREQVPASTDPLADARLILTHLDQLS